jgi:hypothetical protein
VSASKWGIVRSVGTLEWEIDIFCILSYLVPVGHESPVDKKVFNSVPLISRRLFVCVSCTQIVLSTKI